MTYKPVILPLRTINALNEREHWAQRAKRAKKERLLGYCAIPAGIQSPVTVYLTRCGPRKMDDDGLIASCKNLRDGIADKLGIDDGSDSVIFRYAQRVQKTYSVEIEIEAVQYLRGLG